MRKSRLKMLLVAVALTPVLLGLGLAKAQDEQANKSGTKAKELMAAAEKLSRPPVSIYRLDYKVFEIENGKRVNSRDYTLFARTGQVPSRLRTGNRIPYRASDAPSPVQYQYQDVGMNMDSWVEEQGDKVLLRTVLDMSSMAPNESTNHPYLLPVTRHLRLEDETAAIPGKPALVGSIDDVTSNHRYEIEVTATKID